VKLLHSIIEKSRTRIVSISSCGHETATGLRFESFTNGVGYNANEAYVQSKLANIFFANALAERLNGTGTYA
jgi:NAD(P)-dependent dehydrogenase (short-subunit alcohol dehydrogenase family)